MTDMLATFAGLRLADQRLTAAGYPAGAIAKAGSLTMRTAALAGDVVTRLKAQVADLQARLEANEASIRKIEVADAMAAMRAAMARPAAGRA